MRYWIIFIFNFNLLLCSAQTKFCASDEILHQALNNDPRLKSEYLKREKELSANDSVSFSNNYSGKLAASIVYTVPVVFHVLHQDGPENISDAQINDAISILNRDYRKQNADTANIFSPFKAADVRFEFRLATKDTNGNCTNGITRHLDPNTNWSVNFITSNEFKYTWSCQKYLNVYVVKSIMGFGYGGYSSFPGTNPGYKDVIVITNDCVGSFETSDPTRSRILTHETGHWFNLMHIWGNGAFGAACNDDGVTDTPITKGWLNCPSSASLSAVCNSTITENFQNYMDYSSCRYMFSAGQVARMAAAITSTLSGRNNLWSNTNLTATGIINPVSPCLLKADCYSTDGTALNIYTVCAGQSLTFVDATWNGTVTSWSWTGNNAMIASPTASSTSIIFPNSGNYTITLHVSNSAGTSVTSRTVLALNAASNINTSYQESFESPGLPANFSVINGGNWPTWTQTSSAASTGTNSYFIDGYPNQAGSIDIIETPSFDFLNNNSAVFTFKYAYASYSTTTADVFKIQASSDCGGSWTDIPFGNAASLSSGSGGTTTTPFVPTPSQFKTYTLTANPLFNPFKSESNVRIRFYFQKDTITFHGNNIYIDDINFVSYTGINELAELLQFKIYPNPGEDNVTMAFDLKESTFFKFSIKDLTGRNVNEEKTMQLPPGNHKYLINENRILNAGTYILEFYFNEQKFSRKLIIY